MPRGAAPLGRAARVWHGALLAPLLGLALLVLTSGTAWAHAVLIASVPEDGERVDTAPVELRLQFNEPVSPVAVRLLDAQATEIPGVVVEPQGETVVLRPLRPLADGAYYLSYRVTSLDAHVVAATLRFGVGVPPPGSQQEAVAPGWTGWAAVAARLLLYVTALGAVGLTLFVLLVRPPEPVSAPSSRLATRLALAGLATLILRLGIAGLELGGLPAGALASARPWALALSTTLASATLAAGVGLTGIALGRRLPAAATAAAALLVAVSFGLTGHAATAPPRWLTAPALALHVLCGAFWLGSLLPLFWSLRLDPPLAVRVLRRFSQVALLAVALLVAVGGTLAWIQLNGDLSTLASTGYGLRLSTKLAFVAGLLALAAVNRLVLTPALGNGGPQTTRRLRYSLRIDLLLGLAVLAVTASFPLSPPPRALASMPDDIEGEGISVVAAGSAGQALLTLLPGRAGANAMEAWIIDREGVPLTGREATFVWALPSAGIEPSRVRTIFTAPGLLTVPHVPLPRPGRWQLRLDVLVDDFTKLTFEGDVDLP